MEVFEFDKTFAERLSESVCVLGWENKIVPASEVQDEWSYFVELQIEPAGWQALWKIPRIVCENMNVRYPAVVYGTVEHVYFKELKALLSIVAVQEDEMQLPEQHEVFLKDLWPTKQQENAAIFIEKTANCIDALRFFYQNIWMPWDNDNDEDTNWTEKHLDARLHLYFDLKTKHIARPLAAHIHILLAEAYYLQQQREQIECKMNEAEVEDDSMVDVLDKTHVNSLMRLHLRLTKIKHEIEMLENSELRGIYEEIKFDDVKFMVPTEKQSNNSAELNNTGDAPVKTYLVTLNYTLPEQLKFLERAQQHIPAEEAVKICPSLQHALSICNAADCVYLCPGKHYIKFLEYLADNGTLCGLPVVQPTAEKLSGSSIKQQVLIASQDQDSILLNCDGNYTLENLVLDCCNVRTGLLIKNCKVTLKNCTLLGDGKSCTQRGIVVTRYGELVLQNCIVRDFATGLTLNEGAKLRLTDSQLLNCEIALDMHEHAGAMQFKAADIEGAKKCGIYVESNDLMQTNAKQLNLANFEQLQQTASRKLDIVGECNFKNCKQNIFVINEQYSPKNMLQLLHEDANTSIERVMITA